MRPPRVAYFPDSFHEVNGVAHTSRNFEAYARRHNLPFLCVRAGEGPSGTSGSVRTLELRRSAAAVGMEKDLAFDPLFWRHESLIADALHSFQPEIIHLTGPSELGIFAAYFAWRLHVPLAASWHTNVHEYAARRLPRLSPPASQAVENATLDVTGRFYRLASVLFAPNQDLCRMLESRTQKSCHLMQRGVDTELFRPEKRTRTGGGAVVLGYVGRLSIEKNVTLLPKIQRELSATGVETKFLIVGQGDLEGSLRSELHDAEFAGVLRGEALAEAYANMDLFVFPSHTDTFGNVVLEALASGVPAIVTPGGGPKYIVSTDVTGVIAADDEFATAILELIRTPSRLAEMRRSAREYALSCSWDAVFDRVYAAYADTLSRTK